MSEIESKLVGFRRRVRWMLAWRGLSFGAIAGASASVVIAILDFFRVVYTEWLWLLLPVAVGALAGGLFGWFRRVQTQALADSIDRRADLKNRLGTANENPASFGAEVRQDALSHLGSLKPAEVYPVRVTKWHGGAIALSVLAASLFLLGNTPLLLSDKEKTDREELKKIGETVERVAKPILDHKMEELTPEAKELAKKFEEFSKDLKKGRMPKEEAMQKANELAREAEKMTQEKFAKSDESLKKAQDALKQMAMEQAMAESGLKPEDMANMDLDKINEMAEQSDEQSKEKMEALSKEMAELMKKMESGKNEKGDPLSEQEKNDLEAQMDQLKLDMKAMELSQKIKDFLKKLYSQPKFKEILEMMKKLQKTNQEGQEGSLENPKLSEAEIAELKKKLEAMREQIKKELEALADKLKDDKAMQEFLDQLKKSLEDCEGG
jgi:hypothetical protein